MRTSSGVLFLIHFRGISCWRGSASQSLSGAETIGTLLSAAAIGKVRRCAQSPPKSTRVLPTSSDYRVSGIFRRLLPPRRFRPRRLIPVRPPNGVL